MPAFWYSVSKWPCFEIKHTAGDFAHPADRGAVPLPSSILGPVSRTRQFSPYILADLPRVRESGIKETLPRQMREYRPAGKRGGFDQIITTGFFAKFGDGGSIEMPTFGRLFIYLFVLAALVYGGAFWLTEVMDPPRGEIVKKVPHDRFER